MAAALVVTLGGCATSTSSERAERKVAINVMQYEVLQKLYEQKPDAKEEIKESIGYAVFDNANLNFVIASVGNGYGVVTDNKTNRRTYMKMAEAGVGFGAGVKDFSLIMIFRSQAAMDRFVNQGWAFGAQADVAAKAGSQGAAAGAERTLDSITVYQLTDAGFALQATVKGTKFWKDEELN